MVQQLPPASRPRASYPRPPQTRNGQPLGADLEHLESGATHRTRWANINRYRSRTIPQIIDSDTSLCPDLFRIIGLPTGEPIPARPDPKYTLQIGDIAFGRDSDLGEVRTRKRSKYEPLLAKWHAQGWQVDTEVHVIAIGHRGGSLPSPDMMLDTSDYVTPPRTLPRSASTGAGSHTTDSEISSYSDAA